MERLNRQKHLNMALRGAIVGQYLAGSSRAKISRSLNVSVGQFLLYTKDHREIFVLLEING